MALYDFSNTNWTPVVSTMETQACLHCFPAVPSVPSTHNVSAVQIYEYLHTYLITPRGRNLIHSHSLDLENISEAICSEHPPNISFL